MYQQSSGGLQQGFEPTTCAVCYAYHWAAEEYWVETCMSLGHWKDNGCRTKIFPSLTYMIFLGQKYNFKNIVPLAPSLVCTCTVDQ